MQEQVAVDTIIKKWTEVQFQQAPHILMPFPIHARRKHLELHSLILKVVGYWLFAFSFYQIC